MPAVMSTRPSSSASAITWLAAVTALQKVTSQKSTHANNLQESVDKVFAAGEAQEPAYVGHTWLLASTGVSAVATKLHEALDLGQFAYSGLCRDPFKEYCQGTDKLGAAMQNLAPQRSAAVLQSLKLSGIIKGSFMPLTGDASPASSRNSVVMPMVGCHITVQGLGIQWLCHEGLRLEMSGGEYGGLTFEMGTPKVNPIAAHSGATDSLNRCRCLRATQVNLHQVYMAPAEASVAADG